uniref:V-FLIP n=1 Tax=Bovine herpesvirus 4 TaxID=10385 RepID=A0A0F6N5B7_BHV4|nr:v-FLIP [Bovine gammaherpesvirus 4]QJC19201.1 v-FLIP [Bovine gammaherpesvirus 4]
MVTRDVLLAIETHLNQNEKTFVMYFLLDPYIPKECEDFLPTLENLHSKRKIRYPILIELMYILQRFDLLRSIFLLDHRFVKDQITSSHWKYISPYKQLIFSIGQNIDDEDLISIKFISMNYIGKSPSKIKNYLDWVRALEKVDMVGPDNLDLFETFFKQIHRMDIVKMIKNYRTRETLQITL